MSRRKQSNPKPLKLEESSSGGEGHSDKAEDQTPNHKDPDSSSQSSPEASQSPQHRPSPQASPHRTPSSPPSRDRDDEAASPMPPHTPSRGISAGSPEPGGLQEMRVKLMSQLQLPSEVLFLRYRQELGGKGESALDWAVCSAIPLPHGSSLGPFQGEIISRQAVKVGHLIIQFTSKTMQAVLVNVANMSGAWLTLLQSARHSAPCNTHVHFEGGTIWCNVESDLDVGSELVASFTFHAERESPPSPMTFPLSTSPGVTPASPPALQPPVPASAPRPRVRENDVTRVTPTSVAATRAHAALIYGCPFCGVRFSSSRTLQAHIAFYCSKKPPEGFPPALTAVKSESDPPTPSTSAPHPAPTTTATVTSSVSSTPSFSQAKSEPQVKEEPMDTETSATEEEVSMARSPGKRSAEETGSETEGGQPAAKSVKTGHAYRCSDCSYTADKLSSLNRHRRIHNRPATEARGSSAPVPLSETYCRECNIQFSSLSTYQGHKAYYCALRNRDPHSSGSEGGGESKRSLMEGDSATPRSLSPLTPGAVGALPVSVAATYPPGTVLVPAGSVVSGLVTPSMAGAMPGTPAVVIAAPLVTPEGLTSVALTMPTVVVQPLVKMSSSPPASTSLATVSPVAAHSGSSPPKSLALPSTSRSELPLDLSTRRPEPRDSATKETDREDEDRVKEDREKKGKDRREDPADGDQALTVKTESSPTPSSSGSDRKTSPTLSPHRIPTTMGLPGPPGVLAGMVPTLLPLGHVPTLGVPSAVCALPHPASMKKCSDCNIIFYNPENLLAHKQHYCSGKKVLPQLAPTPASSSTASAPSPTAGERAAASPPPPAPQPRARTQTPPRETGELRVKTEPKSPVPPSPVEQWPATSATPGTPGGAPPPRREPRVLYRYFCVPCKIKFSSASTLQAHKQYYCPHGKDSEQTVLVHSPRDDVISTPGVAVSSSSSPPKDDANAGSPSSSTSAATTGGADFRCDQCGNHFVTARLLRLHLCPASESAQSMLLHCSHCEYVTQTENRLNEHMKVHAPNKAYRCRLCGYRGNTVRGMRMHGKMHLDHGEDFTDDHILEFEEPPLVPIQPHNGHPHLGPALGHVASDAELLIRLKNEPYKRRRSRKSFEKSENSRQMEAGPFQCPMPGCGEVLPNFKFFQNHMHLHELAARQQHELLLHHLEASRIKEEQSHGGPEEQARHPDAERVQKKRDLESTSADSSSEDALPREDGEGEEAEQRETGDREEVQSQIREQSDGSEPRLEGQAKEGERSSEAKCFVCDFTADCRKDLERHLEAHRADNRRSDSPPAPPPPSAGKPPHRASSSPPSPTRSPPRTAWQAAEGVVRVKVEKVDSGYEMALLNRHNLPDSDPDSPRACVQPAGCSKSKDSASAERSSGNESRGSSSINACSTEESSHVRVKREAQESQSRNCESQAKRKSPGASPPARGSDRTGIVASPPLLNPTPDSRASVLNGPLTRAPAPYMFPYLCFRHPSLVSTPSTVALTPQTSSPDERGSRYCQNCNITFNFQSSYAAHKQYYCSAVTSKGQASPTPTG